MTPFEVFAVAFLAGLGIQFGMAAASYVLPLAMPKREVEVTYNNLDKPNRK
jgi:hypothetical protein